MLVLGLLVLVLEVAALRVVTWSLSDGLAGRGRAVADLRSEGPMMCPKGGPPRLDVTLQRFDSVRGELLAGLALCVPPAFLRSLRSYHDGRRGGPIVREVDGRWHLRHRYWRKRFRVVMYGASSASLTIEAHSRPLGALASLRGIASPPIPIRARARISLGGDATDYPLDRYNGGFIAGLHAPRGVVGAKSLLMPFRVAVVGGPGMGQLSMRYTVDGPRKPFPYLYLSVRREFSVIAFAGVVLLAPLLLVGALGLLVLTGRPERGQDFRALLVGVAAAMFALLPIRAVLVPEPIIGPTYVDWLLGSEILVFVVVALVGILSLRRSEAEGSY
jgi:Domain of unknown function (DUF4436)